ARAGRDRVRLALFGQIDGGGNRIGEGGGFVDVLGVEGVAGDVGEVGRIHRAHRGGLGDDHFVDERLEFGEDAVGVLIVHHTDDGDESGEVEGLFDRLGEDAGPGGVVRGVDDDGRAGANELEPSG